MNNTIEKLGVGIIAFEGLEHLKNIIYEIRDLTDVIVVCLQQESYHGDPINEEDIQAAQDLKDFGYIDSIIWFEPIEMHENEGPAAARFIETDKRNFILDYLEVVENCSHSLVIDSDEYYDHDDFERAKNEIQNITESGVTYCQYVNYYRDYKHVLVWPFLCYVPFITRSSYRYDFKSSSFDLPSDPSRRYVMKPDEKYVVLYYSLIKMHHLSFIRLDISKKINAWSSKMLFKDDVDLPDKILDRYYNYKEGQNAIVMFNVPNHEVVVEKLPKQYIHPHFKIDDKIVKYEGRNISNGNS